MDDPREIAIDSPAKAGFSDHYAQRFSGIGRLYGQHAMETLARAHVCVIGVGGVGSWVVEALARSGVGRLTLVDLDDVCVTNTNRQLHAHEPNVGRSKIEVMAERARAINPEVEVECVHDFLSAATANTIIRPEFDYVVDAIDQFRNKAELIAACHEHDVPVVVCGGAGGRRDPTRIRVDDLTRTSGDRLLRMLRKLLRREYGFSRRGKWKIACVYSDEPPLFPTADGSVCETRPEGTLRLDCASGFGTATFLTGTFGFLAASIVVSALVAAGEATP